MYNERTHAQCKIKERQLNAFTSIILIIVEREGMMFFTDTSFFEMLTDQEAFLWGKKITEYRKSDTSKEQLLSHQQHSGLYSCIRASFLRFAWSRNGGIMYLGIFWFWSIAIHIEKFFIHFLAHSVAIGQNI